MPQDLLTYSNLKCTCLSLSFFSISLLSFNLQKLLSLPIHAPISCKAKASLRRGIERRKVRLGA